MKYHVKNLIFDEKGNANIPALSTFISLISALILVIANSIKPFLNEQQSWLFPILVVFIGDRFGILLDNISTSRKISELSEGLKVRLSHYSDDIIGAIRGSNDIIYYDDLESALRSIYRDINKASSVENVFVGVQAKKQDALAANPERIYERFLNRLTQREKDQ